MQSRHWTISLLKSWLIGTHAGAVKPKHLQADLDEFAFRYNRRKTNGARQAMSWREAVAVAFDLAGQPGQLGR